MLKICLIILVSQLALSGSFSMALASNPAMQEITGGLLSNSPRPGIKPPVPTRTAPRARIKPPVPGLLTIAPPSVLERIKKGTLLPAPDQVKQQAATSESFQPVMQKVFDKLGVGNKVGQNNILKAMDTVAEIETNRQNIPNALGSSARGYFQYMVGNGSDDGLTFKGSSFETALNRLDNFFEDNNLGPVPKEFKKARIAKTPMGLSYENQRLMAFVDTYNKKGTTALFQKISKGGDVGRKAIDDLYTTSHLTSKSQAEDTADNRNNVIKERSNLINNPYKQQ